MRILLVSLVVFLSLTQALPVRAGGMVERRKQAQRAIMEKQQYILQQRAMMQQQRARQMAEQQAQQTQQAQVRMHLREEPVAVEEVVNLAQMMEALDTSSQPWRLIIDQEAKEAIIMQYIRRFRRRGVVISKPPAFYAGMIDAMSLDTPEMLRQPFERVLQTLAIIDYDFDNGQDKDAMAFQVLGSREAVVQNRARLGLP